MKHQPSFWITQVIGATVVAFGIAGLLGERLGEPPSFFRFFAGALLAHDLVLAPLVFVAAWLVARVLPEWAWPAVRNAGFATVVVLLFSWPALRGYGRRPSNPSILPRDYADGVLVALGVIWLVAAAALVRARLRRQSEASSAPG